MNKDGTGAWHDVDRALTELLGEMRIAEMGEVVLPVPVRIRDDHERSVGSTASSTTRAEPAERVGS